MGKRAEDGRRAEYAHVELPRSRFDAATLDEPSGELESGRFLELAFYGAEETLENPQSSELALAVTRLAAD